MLSLILSKFSIRIIEISCGGRYCKEISTEGNFNNNIANLEFLKQHEAQSLYYDNKIEYPASTIEAYCAQQMGPQLIGGPQGVRNFSIW